MEPTGKYARTTLENLCGGAVAAQFDHELRRVLENIQDVNTDPEAKRQILIKIEIGPTADREAVKITGQVTSKLAGLKPAGVAAFLGEDTDGLSLFARDPRQSEMFEDDDSVRPITTHAQGA